MTQAEIKEKLFRLRYEGKWTLSGIAKESGLSIFTIKQSMNGTMSEKTQVRLSMSFKTISSRAPLRVNSKHKPGHRKRYLIRYFNLTRWCDILANEPGIEKIYKRKRYQSLSKDKCAYVCTQLDYVGKRYLLDLFGEEAKRRKIVFGDCFRFEHWVKKIHNKLSSRRDLIKKLMQRKEF